MFGFADSALLRENWDVTDQEWSDDVLPAIINALDTAMNCDCISNLNFDPVTGTLTYQDGDDNTVTVINYGDTYVSSQYTVIAANQPDADDAYCYAAWLLAEKVADDLQDMLEVVDVLEDATLSVVSEIFASMVDLVPFFGDLAETAIRITDNMAEAAFDWVKENARDVQARALAAEIFYCAIKAAMEGGGQKEIRNKVIYYTGANLIEFALEFINGAWEIPDLWNVFEDAYNALDGEAIGYGIVAWFLLTDFALDTLGADRPIEAIVAHATKHAAAHDSRDCAAFDCGSGWCHLFDFETAVDGLGWAQWQGGNFSDGAWRSVYDAFDTKLAIQFIIPNTAVTSVRVKYSTGAVSGGHPRRIRYNSTIQYENLDAGAGDFNDLIFKNASMTNNIRVQIQSKNRVSTNEIFQIEVCGTGSNPFD